MGLGLSATHNIITAHKGVLDVKSETGHGTLFSISLPLASAAAEEESRNRLVADAP
jgi:nitrogen-specific signal transduction histidine kinase